MKRLDGIYRKQYPSLRITYYGYPREGISFKNGLVALKGFGAYADKTYRIVK